MTEREMEIFKAGFCEGFNHTMDGINSEILGDISVENMQAMQPAFNQSVGVLKEGETKESTSTVQ